MEASSPPGRLTAAEEPRVDHQASGRNRLDAYLTTAEVAKRYRTAESTVRYWRTLDPVYGPRGVRVGKRVLYSIAEVERFDREIATETTADQTA